MKKMKSGNSTEPGTSTACTTPATENSINDWRPNTGSLRDSFEAAFKNQLFSDVCFIVGEEEPERFNASKTILSITSPVFEAMFSGRWSNESEIKVPDVEPAAFAELLRFMYCEKVQLSVEIAWFVLYAANKYAVDACRDHCITFIKSTITMTNAPFLLMKARAINEELLIKLCLEVIANDTLCLFYYKNLDYHRQATLADSERNFLSIDKGTLCSILESDALTILEVTLFKAVLRWAEMECERQGLPVSKANKKLILEDVMPLIRFPLMTSSQFAHIVLDSGAFPENEVASMLLHFTKNSGSPTNFNNAPRNLKFSNRIELFVHVAETGKRLTLNMVVHDTVASLMSLISSMEGSTPLDHVLTFMGAELRDITRTIKCCGIGHGSTLFLRKRVPGLTAQLDRLMRKGKEPYFRQEE